MGECQITLVDRLPEHLYTPLLYEVATGMLEETGPKCRGKLRSGICIGFEQYRSIIGSRHIRYRRGEVVGVDLKSKSVQLKDQDAIAYDDLVIALGSETAYYGIPGLQEHCLPMKTLRDGFALRERLHTLVEEYLSGKRDRLDVVVGGGGATGTEVAAELAHFFLRMKQRDVLRPNCTSVTLVDAASDVLMMLPSTVRALATRRLKSLGVWVMTNTRVEMVDATGVTMKTGDEEMCRPADLVIWCGGIQPSSALKMIDAPKGPKGHLIVDASLRVQGLENVYAIGDCAQVASGKGFVPALAQSAIAEARVVAENLVRHVEGKSLTAWKPPAEWPTIVPLGGKYGIAKLGPFVFNGPIAYLLHKAADLRYWLQILPTVMALRVFLDGARTYIKND